jgi:hypothetical protein
MKPKLNVEWWSRAKVAADLGYSTTTLARWAEEGAGPPFFKFGPGKNAHARYPRAEYEKWKGKDPAVPQGQQMIIVSSTCIAPGDEEGHFWREVEDRIARGGWPYPD